MMHNKPRPIGEIFKEIAKEDDAVSSETQKVLAEIEAMYREAILEEAKRWVSDKHLDYWLSDESRGIKFTMGFIDKKNLKKAIKEFFTDFFDIIEESEE